MQFYANLAQSCGLTELILGLHTQDEPSSFHDHSKPTAAPFRLAPLGCIKSFLSWQNFTETSWTILTSWSTCRSSAFPFPRHSFWCSREESMQLREQAAGGLFFQIVRTRDCISWMARQGRGRIQKIGEFICEACNLSTPYHSFGRKHPFTSSFVWVNQAEIFINLSAVHVSLTDCWKKLTLLGTPSAPLPSHWSWVATAPPATKLCVSLQPAACSTASVSVWSVWGPILTSSLPRYYRSGQAAMVAEPEASF